MSHMQGASLFCLQNEVAWHQCIRTIPSNELLKPMTVEEMISSYSTGKKKKKEKRLKGFFYAVIPTHIFRETETTNYEGIWK